MTWGKVSDRLHAHSKARRAREAMALWVLALSWCCDELTDGVVPADMPELLIPGGDAMAARLVAVGLWEQVEGGFRFHDWATYQLRADDERERRESISKVRSEAGKRGAAKRWQSDGKAMANGSQTDRKAIANGWQNDSPVPVPVPVPEENASRSHASAPTREEPKPSAPVEDLDPLPLLQAISDGATKNGNPKAWDSRAAARTVAAFVRELRRQERTPDEMRVVGAYLASPEAKATHKAVAYSPDWFVSWADGEPDTRRVDWVLRSAREWQAARLKAKAERAAAKSAHEDRAWLDPFAAYRKGAQS